MIKVHKFIFNDFQENTYIVRDDTGVCVIIDPGCRKGSEEDRLHGFISEHGLKPAAVLLTHAHLDHIYGVGGCVRRYGIPVYMDKRETASIEGFNAAMRAWGMGTAEAFGYKAAGDGDSVTFGNTAVRALSVPGHSPGGLCWWIEAEDVIFSGDTLFAGSIGRTDNEWASWDMLMRSLCDTLMALDGKVEVFPGHGPATDIGHERMTNPFILDYADKMEGQDIQDCRGFGRDECGV